jgi:PPOX class probable F420-dependent enzyme
MHTMSPTEARAFLLERPRPAILATVRADGRPHVVPVWFVLDGEDIIFTTWHTTVKAANIRHDSRVCLLVDDDAPPFGYVMIEGDATISDDPVALRHWAGQIGGRYMGLHQADAFGARNGVPGELLVRVSTRKVIGYANISD